MATSSVVLNIVLFLRIFTLLALAASIALMALNNYTDQDDGTKTKFTDLIAYRLFHFVTISFLILEWFIYFIPRLQYNQRNNSLLMLIDRMALN